MSFILSLKRDKNIKPDIKWVVAALSGMFCSGIVGIIQKIFTNQHKYASLNAFLVLAFSFTILIGSAAVFLFKFNERKSMAIAENKGEKKKFFIQPITVIICLLLGTALGFANILNTYLSGVFPSAVSFPVINGGTIVMSTVFSIIIFKERLGKKQTIGLILGIIAIIVTSIGKI